nr:unnamed protein product [Callosobruchus chinensis]
MLKDISDQDRQKELIHTNSTIHSVTKQRPFDLINGRLDALDPFDLSDEVILNQYITDRKARLKFYMRNYTSLQ